MKEISRILITISAILLVPVAFAAPADVTQTSAPPSAMSSSLQVSDAWVRALPPVKRTTAAYLELRNTGQQELVVVGATAERASSVEFHRTRQVDGMMRMERIPELRIAPGGAYSLKPGGAHLMLFGLSKMPATGEELRLCLQLESEQEVCTVAPAYKSEPAGNDN